MRCLVTLKNKQRKRIRVQKDGRLVLSLQCDVAGVDLNEDMDRMRIFPFDSNKLPNQSGPEINSFIVNFAI